ncbi:MAG: hypothetical protein ACYCX2_08165 [Christensenellales bacterium]
MICPQCGLETQSNLCPQCGLPTVQAGLTADTVFNNNNAEKTSHAAETLNAGNADGSELMQDVPERIMTESSNAASDSFYNEDHSNGRKAEEPPSGEEGRLLSDDFVLANTQRAESKRNRKERFRVLRGKVTRSGRSKKYKTVSNLWGTPAPARAENGQRKDRQQTQIVCKKTNTKKGIFANNIKKYLFSLFPGKNRPSYVKQTAPAKKRKKNNRLVLPAASAGLIVLILLLIILGGRNEDKTLLYVKDNEVYCIESGKDKAQYLMGDIQLQAELDETDYPIQDRYFTNNTGDIIYYLSDIKGDSTAAGSLQAKRSGAVEPALIDSNVIAGKIFSCQNNSVLFYYKDPQIVDGVLYGTLMKTEGQKAIELAGQVVVDTAAVSPDGKIVRYAKNVKTTEAAEEAEAAAGKVSFESYLQIDGQKEKKQQDDRRPLVQFNQSELYVYARQSDDNKLEIYFAQGDSATRILTSETNELRNIMIVSDFQKKSVLIADLHEKDIYIAEAGGQPERVDTAISSLVYDEETRQKVTEIMPGSQNSGFLSAEIPDSLAYIKNSNLYYRKSSGERITVEENVSSVILRDHMFVYTYANTTGNISLYAKRLDQKETEERLLLAENVKIGSQQFIENGVVLCLTQYAASKGELSAIRLQGNTSKRILLDTDVNDMCYNRSSGKVVYLKNFAQGAGDLCTVNLDGSGVHTVDTGVTAFYDAAAGKTMYYTKITTNDTYDVYRTDTANPKPVCLTTDAGKVFLPKN